MPVPNKINKQTKKQQQQKLTAQNIKRKNDSKHPEEIYGRRKWSRTRILFHNVIHFFRLPCSIYFLIATPRYFLTSVLFVAEAARGALKLDGLERASRPEGWPQRNLPSPECSSLKREVMKEGRDTLFRFQNS